MDAPGPWWALALAVALALALALALDVLLTLGTPVSMEGGPPLTRLPRTLAAGAALALLSLPGLAQGLVPGCGFPPSDFTSCWREAKSGPLSGPRCRSRTAQHLAHDPWVVSSDLAGTPLRAHLRLEFQAVRVALGVRYGWGLQSWPGGWPLGGPVDEPWAESLSTLVYRLQWACDHREELPPSLQRRMGSPLTHDMELTPREVYDLVFFGGARALAEMIAPLMAPPPPSPPAPPANPHETVVFVFDPPRPLVAQPFTVEVRAAVPIDQARLRLPDGTFVAGTTATFTAGERGELTFRAAVRIGTTRNHEASVEVLAEPPSPPPPSPAPTVACEGCPLERVCLSLWDRILRRHDCLVLRPEASSTGRLGLELRHLGLGR